jgi:hypothetical protein
VQQLQESPSPVLSFSGHHLVSALMPGQMEAFTLVIAARHTTSPGPRPQLLFGVEPHPSGWTPFGLFTEPSIPGGFRLKTGRGTASLTLPPAGRNAPFIFGFRRTAERQEAWLAGRKITLPELNLTHPDPEPGHLPSFQLGGTSDQDRDFHGWIGAVLIADRALSDAELQAVFREFRQRYGIRP